MEFLADTHIHVYPAHQPERLLDAAGQNLRRWAKTDNPDVGLFWVETAGLNTFESWYAGSVRLSNPFRIEPSHDSCSLQIVNDVTHHIIWCFAGRQIVTAERLEILGLVMNGIIPDGLSAADTIRRVLDVGGIPVLPWGLGKWLLGRSPVVKSVLDEFNADQLWVGDNAMRPKGWFASAPLRDQNRRIIAGSDPLPMPGEESMAGSYGTRFTGQIDPHAPSESARTLLRCPPSDIERIGHRNHLLTTGRRMWHYRQRSAQGA